MLEALKLRRCKQPGHVQEYGDLVQHLKQRLKIASRHIAQLTLQQSASRIDSAESRFEKDRLRAEMSCQATVGMKQRQIIEQQAKTICRLQYEGLSMRKKLQKQEEFCQESLKALETCMSLLQERTAELDQAKLLLQKHEDQRNELLKCLLSFERQSFALRAKNHRLAVHNNDYLRNCQLQAHAQKMNEFQDQLCNSISEILGISVEGSSGNFLSKIESVLKEVMANQKEADCELAEADLENGELHSANMLLKMQLSQSNAQHSEQMKCAKDRQHRLLTSVFLLASRLKQRDSEQADLVHKITDLVHSNRQANQSVSFPDVHKPKRATADVVERSGDNNFLVQKFLEFVNPSAVQVSHE